LSRVRLVGAVFVGAAFLGASLLFLVQPMIGKMMLPLLGGSASVWTTCMLFFQAGLLAGYAYAHVLTSRLSVPRQVGVHAAVLLAPLLVLPMSRAGLAPPEGDAPVPWLLGTLALVAGAPFFALAATGPLVQRWLHATDHPGAADPYVLYAASNAGSFAGLLLYPFLLEPWLPVEAAGPWSQTRVWAVGYGLCVAAVLATGLIAARSPRERAPASHEPAPTRERRLLWIVLAFVPSSAVLGVTQYVTTELAAVPLLWVVPLAIYLLTFVVAFSPRRRPPPRLLDLALGVVAVLTAATMTPAFRSHGRMLVVVHFAMLAVLGLALHGRLAEARPGPSQLTEFYLWIALGGALGGVFNAIVAPLAFKSVVEYPLALFLAVLLRPGVAHQPETRGAWPAVLDVLVPVTIGAVAVLAVQLGPETGGPVPWSTIALQTGIPALVALSAVRSPLRFALALGVLLEVGWWQSAAPRASLHRERTFFGVHRVVPTLSPWFRREQDGTALPPERREFISLVHGATLHGVQAVEPEHRRTPTAYYHRTGPLGQAWQALSLDATARAIGIVGLGAGTIAAYGGPGQTITYFEIDPAVVRIARDAGVFTYLADTPSRVDVVLGDGRVALAGVADARFDVLVLDAFSSDAIPVHLLTKEAVELYLRKLAPDGVLLVHLSNQYLRLEAVVSAIAGNLRVPGAVTWDAHLPPETLAEGKNASKWAILGRSAARLEPILSDPRWHALPLPPAPGAADPERVLWTDDRSDLIAILKRL
jgi:SAM-dependent methyltransferase